MAVNCAVAVVGATGRQGGAATRALLAAGAAVRALVRDPAKPAAAAVQAAGAQRVVADFDHPDTVEAAFAGTSRVFLMTTMDSGRETAGETADRVLLADAAKRASVEHLSTPRSAVPSVTPASRTLKVNAASKSILKASPSRRRSFGPPSSTKTCWANRQPLKMGPSWCVCHWPTASPCRWWPSTISTLSRRRPSSTRTACLKVQCKSPATNSPVLKLPRHSAAWPESRPATKRYPSTPLPTTTVARCSRGSPRPPSYRADRALTAELDAGVQSFEHWLAQNWSR
jgi:hypothetical protein